MKVLILTTDKSAFTPTSETYRDIVKCSERIDQLHVVVLTTKKDKQSFTKVSDKLYFYPTNSAFSWLFLRDAYSVVKTQIFSEPAAVADLICARNSLHASLAACLLSWRHKKNFIVDILDNNFPFRGMENTLADDILSKLSGFVFRRASAVRVISQIQGEMIYARNPKIEKKIYILPVLDQQKMTGLEADDTGPQTDIHRKFSQFNIVLLAMSRSVSAQGFKKAAAIMNELRLRYPRIGLVIVSTGKNPRRNLFAGPLSDYVVVENATSESIRYYQTANAYIDIESDDHGSEGLISATHAGCPIVAAATPANMNLIRDGENGFLCDPENPKQFARKVIDILEQPGLREMMKMYRYNITDLYGTDPEDYYTRLLTIWESYKTPGADSHIDLSFSRDHTEKKGFYPAFTLDTVRKVFKKFQENNAPQKRIMYREFDESQIFDTDSIKIGIEKALEEIQADQQYEIAEPEVADIEV